MNSQPDARDFGENDLGQQMAAASMLPSDDPVRLALEAAIAALGDHQSAARKEWLALLEEAANMKTSLHSVTPPPGLEDRLLQLPQSMARPWYQRSVGELLTPRLLAAAAAIVIIVAAGWWGVSAFDNYRETRRLDKVAVLAANLQTAVAQKPPGESLDTSNAAQAEKWLAARLPLHDIVGTSARLTEVGVVKLGTAPAALTRWNVDGQACYLIEFDPGSFGLPENFPQKNLDSLALGIPGPARKIILWSNPAKHCAWGLVMGASTRNVFTY